MDSIPGLSRYKNGRKDRGLDISFPGPVGSYCALEKNPDGRN